MGDVTVERPTSEMMKSLGVDSWSPWEHEAATFEWEYDTTERFYVIEGAVSVILEDGREVSFGAGDLVTFPAGTRCTWTIIEPIRKVYTFIFAPQK